MRKQTSGSRTALKAGQKAVLPKRTRHGERNETTIRLRIEALAEGGYVATSPDVPGLVAEGRSVTEAVEIAQGLTRKIIESCLEHGDPLPKSLRGQRRGRVGRRWDRLYESN